MYVLGPQLISDGQIDTLRGLLERIGEPATNDPACALTWGWCDYIGGHYARAQEWVDDHPPTRIARLRSHHHRAAAHESRRR